MPFDMDSKPVTAPDAAFRLRVRIEDHEVAAVVASAPLEIGSSETCDVHLAEPTVSRRHARVRALPGGLEVTDLDSRNGTRVRGRRIGEPTLVQAGEALRLGELTVHVEALDPGDARTGITSGETPPDGVQGRSPEEQTVVRPTLGSTGITAFCLRELDPLLREVPRTGSLPRFAARVLEALARTEPAAGFVLRRGNRDAILAQAGNTDPDRPQHALQRDGIQLTAHADDADALSLLRPLAQLALGLLVAAATLLERGGAVGSAPQPGGEAAAGDRQAPQPPFDTAHAGLRETYWQAARVARSRLNVLITGPSGTGKELLARYLHDASDEDRGAFLVLNCAALPSDLLDAELFGIERGIATGVTERPGRFELAHGGTLFLDEIGDMSLDTQARILRVLQERVVYRVGSHKPRPADVRVVSATNRDLEAMVADGGFRLDLFHRIADWRAQMPPLADRPMDIPNLAMLFLEEAGAQRGIRPGGISEAALAHLLAYRWPGNVRELEREMQRIALFLDSREVVVSTQLKPEIRAARRVDGACTLAAHLAREEYKVIARTLQAHKGHVADAARTLGMGRTTLYRRMGQLGITPEGTSEG